MYLTWQMAASAESASASAAAIATHRAMEEARMRLMIVINEVLRKVQAAG